jgi:hypothetical protein
VRIELTTYALPRSHPWRRCVGDRVVASSELIGEPKRSQQYPHSTAMVKASCILHVRKQSRTEPNLNVLLRDAGNVVRAYGDNF